MRLIRQWRWGYGDWPARGMRSTVTADTKPMGSAGRRTGRADRRHSWAGPGAVEHSQSLHNSDKRNSGDSEIAGAGFESARSAHLGYRERECDSRDLERECARAVVGGGSRGRERDARRDGACGCFDCCRRTSQTRAWCCGKRGLQASSIESADVIRDNPILAAAEINGHFVVMYADRISIFSAVSGGWTESNTFAMEKRLSRDPRGILLPNADGGSFTAYAPGAECMGSYSLPLSWHPLQIAAGLCVATRAMIRGRCIRAAMRAAHHR